jgi:iron complex outermembrane receptor protein
MYLDKYSSTDIDLSYTFNFKVLKALTLGISIYNVFSAEFDNNGWAYCELNKDANGKIYAWSTDEYEAGFAPQAPCNFLIHASIRF